MEIIGIQLDKPYSYLAGPKKATKGTFPAKEGSNVVAISGAHTESGNCLMAISPHQPLEGIYSFYEIHLFYRKTQKELYGFILPITFTIFMGTNFSIAWGSTASYPDMYSVYEVNIIGALNKKLSVEEGLMPITKHTYINYLSYYGRMPVPIIKKYYRTTDGKPIVKVKGRYYLIDIPLVGHCLGAEINYKLSFAKSVKDVLDLLHKYRYPYIDVVAIDMDNNMLYVHNAYEPIRDLCAEYYLDTIPLKSKSQIPSQFENSLFYVLNPASGYICCANQSPLHINSDFNSYNGRGLHYANENSRSTRIKNLLESIKEIKKINIDDLKEIFADTKVYLPVVRGIDFSIIDNMNGKGTIGYLLSVLQSWDGEANIESEGAAVFALLFYRYKDLYYTYHKDPDTIKIATESEIRRCLNWVNKFYKKGQRLGDIQVIQRGPESYPIGGIPDSINTTRSYFEHGKLIAEEGSAFRMLIDLKNKDIRSCHPYGASSNEESAHYTSQLGMYINNEYKRLKPMDYYKQNFTTKRVIQ